MILHSALRSKESRLIEVECTAHCSPSHIHQAQHLFPPLDDLPCAELEGDGLPARRIARVKNRAVRQEPAHSNQKNKSKKQEKAGRETREGKEGPGQTHR